MKVGLIGLGRMGEGMSRRMMKEGIEVWGYRRNYAKAEEAFEKGYVSGVTTSIELLCQEVKSKGPGVFMMVVPAENVEDTINELLLSCGEGDIIIDHGNSNFKDSRRRAERLAKLGIQYLDCGTSGGVYGLERGYCLMVGGSDQAVSVCSPIFRALSPGVGAAPRTDPKSYLTSPEFGWLHCGPAGAGHFVKMVHNGVEYGIMQAYAEGFNILHEANAGQHTLLKAMLRLLRWRIRGIISMILTVLKWLSFGVAVASLGLGYLTLQLMYYAAILSLASTMEEYQTLVKVVGLFTLLWISVFQPLLLLLLSSNVLGLENSDDTQTKSLTECEQCSEDTT